MIKDFFISFRDNFREKTRNPFLGAYLIVWLFSNWKLIYALFNFDRHYTLQNKIDFISSYYNEKSFYGDLFLNVGLAFTLLLVTYILLNLSRFIVNFSEKQVSPWVYKVTDSKSIVLKSDFEQLRNERDELQGRLDRERDSKSRLESRIKELEEREFKNFESKLTGSDYSNEKSASKVKIDKIVYELEGEHLLNEFKSISNKIKNKEEVENDYSIDKFIEFNIIEFAKHGDYGNFYKLTRLGREVLHYMEQGLKSK